MNLEELKQDLREKGANEAIDKLEQGNASLLETGTGDNAVLSTSSTEQPVTVPGKAIGSSKVETLFGKLGTTKFRSIPYPEGEKPLHVDEIKDKRTSPDVTVRLEAPVTSRIADVERVTKLLGKPGGIRWLAGQAALESLDTLRNPFKGDNWKGLGRKLVEAAALVPSTLIQVAAAGTGEHQTPYLESRGYLLSGNSSSPLNTVLASIGITTGTKISGANEVLAGQKVNITGSLIVGGGLVSREYTSSVKPKVPRIPGLPDSESIDYFLGSSWESSSVGKYSSVTGGDMYKRTWTWHRPEDNVREIRNGTLEVTMPYGAIKAGSDYIDGRKKGTGVNDHVDYNYDHPKYGRLSSGNTAKFIFGKSGAPVKKGDTENYQSIGLTGDSDGKSEYNFIPFTISTITPDTGSSVTLHFDATLDSYQEHYTGEWTGINYVGRAERFWSYSGFDRSISFGFTVLARNENQLPVIYQKLNKLLGTTAPTYNSNGMMFMRGTFVTVTIGNLLEGQPGFFKELDLTWEKEDPWEIEGGKQVPQVLTVKAQFVPIHTFVPVADSNFIASSVVK